MNSERSSPRPFTGAKGWIPALLTVLSFLGLLDASYLTIKHYAGTPLRCGILEGCEQVATSPYATVFTVPVALFGALFYLAIFALSILYLDRRDPAIFSIVMPVTFLGFLVSLYLVYLQLFVIQAVCFYCLISAATATALFALGFSGFRHLRGAIEAAG